MSDMTVDSDLVPSNPDLEAEPTRPDWLPSNFTKPEDLVKSFGEAQASKTRAEQKAAALEARLEAIEAEQQQQVQAQQQYQQTNDLAARLDQARENGDTQTELAMMAYVAQQAVAQTAPQQQQQILPPDFVADYASSTLERKHDDWMSYRDKAAQYLADNSYLITDEVASNPQLLVKRLGHAYEVVKAQALLDGTAPAAAAAEQAEAQRQAKLAAQSLQGANGRPAPVTENPFQEVMNAPVLNYRDLFR